jgi:hypothetical protein
VLPSCVDPPRLRGTAYSASPAVKLATAALHSGLIASQRLAHAPLGMRLHPPGRRPAPIVAQALQPLTLAAPERARRRCRAQAPQPKASRLELALKLVLQTRRT